MLLRIFRDSNFFSVARIDEIEIWDEFSVRFILKESDT